jgi:hypothetical protein
VKRDLIAAIDLRVTLYAKDAPDRYLIDSDVDGLLDAIALLSPPSQQRNRAPLAATRVRVSARELAALAAD